MSVVPPRGPSICRFLLGLFIVWQLLFLLTGNAAPFLLAGLTEDQQSSALAKPLELAEKITDGWVCLTGQGQGWRLFAPEVQNQALFVHVECDDGVANNPSRQFPSGFEPDPSGFYLHLPGSEDRLFHLEKELSWPLVAWEPAIEPSRRDEWQTYLHDSVRKQWRAYRTFLAWRSGAAEGAVPRSLILSVRIYPPSMAGMQPDLSSIVTLKLVRWRPAVEPPAGCLPLEVYNPWNEEFRHVTAPKEDTP